MAQLGFKSTFFGTLAIGLEADWVVDGMRKDGVVVGDCPRYSGYPCPNSVVLTNSATGSRTIIHTNLGEKVFLIFQSSALVLQGYLS